jgi:hypothetical protein
MASKRVQAYLGLPTAEDITTTQTNVIWRDKLAREDRCARALSRHTAPRPPAHARRAACHARSQGKGRVAQAVGRALRRDEVAVGGRPHPPAPAPADSHAAVAAAVSRG